jgi:hypothetical protein
MTVSVSIEEIRRIYDRIAEINNYDLKDIIWTENDSVIVIDPRVIECFKYVGLSNTYFIETEFYKARPGDFNED